FVESQRHAPGSIRALGRMHVLEIGHVSSDDDDVHPFGVLDVEVAYGLAAIVTHTKRELEGLPGRCDVLVKLQSDTVVGDSQPAHDGALHLHVTLGRRRSLAQRLDGAADQCSDAEEHCKNGDECGEPHRSCHAAASTGTCSWW